MGSCRSLLIFSKSISLPPLSAAGKTAGKCSRATSSRTVLAGTGAGWNSGPNRRAAVRSHTRPRSEGGFQPAVSGIADSPWQPIFARSLQNREESTLAGRARASPCPLAPRWLSGHAWFGAAASRWSSAAPMPRNLGGRTRGTGRKVRLSKKIRPVKSPQVLPWTAVVQRAPLPVPETRYR